MNPNTNSHKSQTRMPSKERNPWSEPEPEARPVASSSKAPLVSLSLVFIIMAALAVMAAMASPGIARMATQPANDTMKTYFVLCGFLGKLVGAVAGALHYRRLKGIVWGAITGVGIGIYVGILAFTPVDSFEQAILPACVGSVFVVGLAAVVRLARNTSVKPEDSSANSPFDDEPGR